MDTQQQETPKPKRKAKAKPQRTISLVREFDGNGQGAIIAICAPKEERYFVDQLASEFGRGFRVRKCEALERVYDVLIDGQQSSCECMAALRWGHCRHIDGLQALIGAGKL